MTSSGTTTSVQSARTPAFTRRIIGAALWTVRIGLALLILAWLIGRVLTDRYAWSQWLFWIPTPAIILASIVGLGLALVNGRRSVRRRWHLAAWSVSSVALLAHFAMIEHRLLRSAPLLPQDPAAIKILHWNVQPSTNDDVPPSVDVIAQIDADLTIITNPGGTNPQQTMRESLSRGKEGTVHALSMYPFALFSTMPIVNVRPLILVDGKYVIVVQLDATQRLGRTLTVYLVDLPSNPRVSRMHVAHDVRRMLDDLDAPDADLAVGDFNIPRGSASINVIFPSAVHAFAQAGHGYGATFPRNRPLYHIDHVLVGPQMRAVRYDIMDPGCSRHRAQIAWVTTKPMLPDR